MIEVREMQIDDLEQVMTIENELFSVPWTETGYFSFLMRNDTMFLVAEEEEEILGYCGVIMAADEGDITNVAVRTDRQGEGIGKLLIRELAIRTAEVGVAALHLEVRESNEKAIGLYGRMGFEKIGVRKHYYTSPTEDAVLMCRRG